MIKNGISEENLMKLFTHAQIGPKEQDMVRNLANLGVSIVSDVSVLYSFLFPIELFLILCFFVWSRAAAIRNTPLRVRNALPSTHTKCRDGRRLSKTSWRTVSRTNSTPDTFPFWPVALRAPLTKGRPGNFAFFF